MNRIWVLIALCVAACSSPPPRQEAPLRNLVTAMGAAEAHYRKRDWPAAERAYRDVLAIDPQSVDANIRLGVIAHQRGEFPLAEEHFNKALAIDSRNATATYNLAVLHIEQAHELFDRYLKVSSTKAAERPAVYELQRAMQPFRTQP